MKHLRIILCMILATACGSGFAQVSTHDDLAVEVAQSLTEWLQGNLEERGVPGAAWAIVAPDSVIDQQTWGHTSLDDSRPITADSIFCIRSVSKSVTALAVLIAVQENTLDLDTPISRYLPDFEINSLYDQNPADQITLRHMLAHWASFAHDPPFGIDADAPDYFQNYISRISDTWLRFPIGYRYEYSNYGYDIAGYILELESGMSLAEFAERKIFRPLGMADSTFDLNEFQIRENRAIGHKGQTPLPVKFPETASGGVYSSIRDMGKYAAFHLNHGMVEGRRLLREDLMDQYHAIQYARRDQKTGYTLGLIREPVGRTFSLYHEGGGRGFGSHLMLYPELGISAVLLTNREYHGLTGFPGREVMNGPVRKRVGLNVVQSTDPRVEKILGRYGDSPGITVQISDGQLGLNYGETEYYDLAMHEENSELVGHYGEHMEVRFLKPFNGRPGSMMLVNRNVANHNNHYRDFNDSPADPSGPDKIEWIPYVGTYDIIWEDEPTSIVEIEVRNGYLYFRDGKSEEIESGLFRYYDGNTIDFRTDPPTFAQQELRKRASTNNQFLGYARNE